MPFSEPSARPPLMLWLRTNLGLMTAFISIIGMIAGSMVNGAVRIAKFEARVASIEKADIEVTGRVNRLDDLRLEREEQRIKLAADLEVVNHRLTVVEQLAKQLVPLQSAITEADQHSAAAVSSNRHDIDQQISTVSQRLAVLESQLRWFVERMDPVTRLRPLR